MEFWLYFSLMFALGMQVTIEQAAKEAWTSPKQRAECESTNARLDCLFFRNSQNLARFFC
jgi:hypothetical protein